MSKMKGMLRRIALKDGVSESAQRRSLLLGSTGVVPVASINRVAVDSGDDGDGNGDGDGAEKKDSVERNHSPQQLKDLLDE